MASESPGSGRLDQRLVELFKEASSLSGEAREEFVRRVREGDSALAASLVELLGQEAPVPSEPGSLAQRIREQYGSEADPHITLEAPSAPESDFASEIVKRLAGREGAYGRYQLKGEVARGGQGAILRVWDEDLRRNLAMKVVLGKGQESGGTPKVDSKTLGRFLEEAQVTGQLDHPGIVPVHELGLDSEGQIYFTMKLVKGRDLKAIFDLVHEGKEGWSQTRALTVLLKVCEAMAYAHSKGVVHRDLKPSNIMVGKYGEVYVMDWGLARVVGRDNAKDIRIRPPGTTTELKSERHAKASDTPDSPLITMDGDVVGTPAYMSPEQAAGNLDAVGPRSDVYAAGAMLYHLLAGHMPYVPPGMSANSYAVWQWVQDGPPKRLEHVAPGAPVELVAICDRAMSRELTARYGDMGTLAEDLSAFLEHRVVSAYETGAWAEARKWIARNKALATSLATAVLLLIGGLATSLVFKAQADENASLAQEQAQLATRNAEETAEQARIAKANEEKAREQKRIASERADDVLRLSALQDLEDLLAEADALWPAQPEKIEAYESWIETATLLVADIAIHREKRVELRARALPRDEDQIEAERESHPEWQRLEALRGEIDAQRHALVQRRDGVRVELPTIDWSEDARDASALKAEAWPLVDPERETFGDEPRGLVLALRALDEAGEDTDLRATIGDTVAWAYFALGRDDEALNTMFAALDEAAEAKREEFEGNLAKLEDAVVAAAEEGVFAAVEASLDAREAQRDELEQRMNERRDWHFPESEPEARWWNNQLTKLIEGLQELEDGLLSKAEDAVTETYGWSMPRRLGFAELLRDGYGEGGPYALQWDEILPALRVAYPGLDLVVQMGLVPLGPDAASGLWEFGDLATGVVAERGEDGKLVLTEETGLVFVLLPGGSFLMGAQSSDESGANFDPQAVADEGPVHEVTLSPFFLSKYEMTQGQWQRFMGRNPSAYQPPGGLSPSLLHPVEQVNWSRCVEACERLGFSLPSEAQWEYGARAGTSTVWWTGDERESLVGAVNLADQAAKRGGATWSDIKNWPELQDGYAVHAPVGQFKPNPFGLYNVHGNVWEWCLDGYDSRFYDTSSVVDPVSASGSSDRLRRGGGFGNAAAYARSALRSANGPALAGRSLGLRPARAFLFP